MMKWFLLLALVPLACNSSSQESRPLTGKSDREQTQQVASFGITDAWKERVRANTCHRPVYSTSSWPEFVTGKGQLTIRVPRFLPQDRYEAARESAKAGRVPQGRRSASGWNNLPTANAQLSLGVQDSVKLVFSGPVEQEERLCLERIDGAEATVLSYKWTIHPGDDAYLGPYIAFANMRFPDGLSLQVLGSASTPEQRDQMLAAIRTIHRIPRK
jgi:hypothetical protein